MKTKTTAVSLKAVIAAVLAAILAALSLPFAACKKANRKEE